MWLKFTKTFRWRPTPNTSIRYSPGMEKFVTRACAKAALEADAAVKIPKPKEAAGGKAGKDTESGAAAAEA